LFIRIRLDLYNVEHEQEIHVNEYMVPDGQSYGIVFECLFPVCSILC